MKAAAAGERMQYLTCGPGNEMFAFEIDNVREILDFPQLTKIPQS